MDSNYHDAAVRSANYLPKLSAVALMTVVFTFKVFGQTNVPLEILATDATNYIHQQVIVRDVVVQVAVRPTLALLNLGQRYPDSPLTCVIRGKNTNNFPNLENYTGQRVEISGRVTKYQGRPQIILTTTNQIRILGAVPISLNPAPATNDPASQIATQVAAVETAIIASVIAQPIVTAQPSVIAQSVVTAQPVAPSPVKSNNAVWWIVGMFAVIIVMLAALFQRRGNGKSIEQAPDSAPAQLTASTEPPAHPLAAEEWRQRALVAEAMAGRQGQILREKLMPELAEFAKQSLVQGLYAQRNALIEAQTAAQQALVELEARLAALQLSLPERIRAYEKRIRELEHEVETQGDGMRDMTRATLVLVRKKLEDARERERVSGRFN